LINLTSISAKPLSLIKEMRYKTRGIWGPSPGSMVKQHEGKYSAVQKEIIEKQLTVNQSYNIFV
jgi:hypothetical protein